MLKTGSISIEDKIRDNYSSTLLGYKLIDRVNSVSYSVLCNETANGSSVHKYIDYSIVPKLVEQNKEFRARFNYPIQTATIIKSNINVKNSFAKIADTSLEYSHDRKSVMINSPKEGYQQGNYYTLFIKNMLTDGGNGLNDEKKYSFYIP